MSLIIEYNGKRWETDEDGFRIDNSPLDIVPDNDWYDYVRIKYGMPKLTSEHIEILEFYQDFFKRMGVASPMNIAAKELNKSKESILKLFYLDNPLKTIIMMAGLPRPIGPDMPDKVCNEI